METTPPNQQPPAGVTPPGRPAYPQYPGTNELPQQTGAGGTSSLAIAGFVLSLVGGFVISAVLCVVALNRIPLHNQRGKGFAIAGLVISVLWVAIIGAAVAFGDDEPDRDASGQVTAIQTTRPDKLRVGDCVTSIKEGDVRGISVQPCDQANGGGKVFAVFELPAGDWPGLASVQADAEKGCTTRFTALKQPAATPSDIFFLHPTEAGWGLGDRGATCLLTPQ